MKNNYLSMIALLLSFASFSQTYEEWGLNADGNQWDTVYNYGEYSDFEFTGLPLGALGSATLVVWQDGDFGDAGEHCTAYDLNSTTQLGNTTSNPMGDCTLDSMTINFAAANLDVWQSAGSWWVRIEYSPEVDFFCGDFGDQARVRVRLIYDFCPAGPPMEYASIIASATEVCPSTTVDLTGSPVGGTFSGTAVSGTTFDPANLSKGSYTVTYEYEYSAGCITSDNISIRVLPNPGNQSILVCEGGNSPAIEPINTPFAYSNDMTFSTIFAQEAGYSYGPVVNSPDTIYYQQVVGNDIFVLDTAMQTNSMVIDHDAVTGDDRTGIALTDNYVYVIGDDFIGRYNIDLSGPGVQYQINDGLFSDIRTRTLWSLYNVTNDEVPDSPGSFDVEAIAGLDEDLNMTGEIITLSSTVTMGSGGGIFAGYGKLGLYDGNNLDFYVVDLVTGDVTVAATNISLNLYGGENWADWGVLSYDGTDYIANYADNNGQIVAHNLTTDNVVDLSSFTDVSDMATFTYHAGNNRVYFHYENSGQFGGSSETLGYIDASATIVVDNNGVLYGCPSRLEFTFNSIDLGNDTTICQSAIPLVLEAGFGYNSYTWNGVNNNWNVYPVSTSGTYIVEALDEINCVVTDEIVVTVDQCLGLNEDQMDVLSVYPNPNNGVFTVQVPNTMSEGSMTVVDLNGRVVAEDTFSNNTNGLEINVRGIENGMYIVRIATTDAQYQTQVIVQK